MNYYVVTINKNQVDEFIKLVKYKKFNGYELNLKLKQEIRDFKIENNIFVKNIPQDTSLSELEEFASKFGKVKSVKIKLLYDIQKKTIIQTDFGYIYFNDL